MVSFDFEAHHNLGGLNRVISAWRRGIDTELLPLLAKRVKDQTRARVARTKTSPDGRRWIGRKKSKARHGLMTKSRKLLRSINAARQSRDTMVVGSPLPYARAHQEGTSRGLPRREIFGLGRQDLADVDDAIDAWTMRFGSRTRSLARELAR